MATTKKDFKTPPKLKRAKVRNWLAVHAHFRTGAGRHTDKKKKQSKEACRGNNRDY